MLLNEDQRDCMQEITNVAMGQAAERLAQLLEAFVVLSIPYVNTLSPSDIAMALHSLESGDNDNPVSGVCQGFIGGGLRGEAMLIFNDASFADLADLLKYDQGELDSNNSNELTTEHELLMDCANILIGGCLRGLAEQLDTHFSFGPPMLLGQHCPISEILNSGNMRWQKALVVEINYKIENRNVNCDLLLVMSEDCIDGLLMKLDYLLDD